eukprot:CAMPEP_0167776126 /NCGR_PEP_ID=MMETSP0111_2-20121227/2954_1 /TAXON_ID=91324 /ORGANISM="Lotharella globosa, Strain CCCM811" /LENGTH=115 /DNA_ID=CAMNT_0007666143 /DNA_START=98 /DNA_END=445 /DNA_ORIENTATION=+
MGQSSYHARRVSTFRHKTTTSIPRLSGDMLVTDENNGHCRNTNEHAEPEVIFVVLQSVNKEYASTKFTSKIVSAEIQKVYSKYRIQPKKGHNWGHSGKRLWVDDGLRAVFRVVLR